MAYKCKRLLTAAAMLTALAIAAPAAQAQTEATYNGSAMWLRYCAVSDPTLLGQYRAAINGVIVEGAGANKSYRYTLNLRMETGATERLADSTLEAARDELVRGLSGLLDESVPVLT